MGIDVKRLIRELNAIKDTNHPVIIVIKDNDHTIIADITEILCIDGLGYIILGDKQKRGV